jgi:hypothetical protein
VGAVAAVASIASIIVSSFAERFTVSRGCDFRFRRLRGAFAANWVFIANAVLRCDVRATTRPRLAVAALPRSAA